MTETADISLAAALAAAQAEFEPIAKSSKAEAGKYGYTYAPLDVVLGAVRPVLAKNGIALTQTFEYVDGILFLTTALMKGSEKIESDLPIQQLADPQKLGGLITYMRRYSILAICGVMPEDEDDDAQSVSNPAQPPQRTAPVQQPAKAKLYDDVGDVAGEYASADAWYAAFTTLHSAYQHPTGQQDLIAFNRAVLERVAQRIPAALTYLEGQHA